MSREIELGLDVSRFIDGTHLTVSSSSFLSSNILVGFVSKNELKFSHDSSSCKQSGSIALQRTNTLELMIGVNLSLFLFNIMMFFCEPSHILIEFYHSEPFLSLILNKGN